MRNSMVLFLLLLFFACNQLSDNRAVNDPSETTHEAPKTEEEIIADIRKKFEAINQNSAAYQIKSMDLSGESTEGGELKSYYQNEALQKAVVNYYGEMGKLTEEYYFSDGDVFFVFTQHQAYDQPMYMEGAKVVKTEENRNYFHNNKLIRWLNPDKEKVADSNFNQKQSEIFQKINELKEALESHKAE